MTQVPPEGRGLDAVLTCQLYNGQSATEKVTWDEEKRTYGCTLARRHNQSPVDPIRCDFIQIQKPIDLTCWVNEERVFSP